MNALQLKKAVREALKKELGFSPLSRQILILKHTPKYTLAQIENGDLWRLDHSTNRIRKEKEK